ncbi:hypothetical protein DICPUDRAFT_49939 [Dictyostelium purpureum]|uniref:Uncharacterized protein n=1 Tax=Dictyostelium purpureum TaxID=5786 RepID=F0ZW34_DICPU|nr:uncharacterized protein DICPUDRAFT_49939 [Dictyostelium purpureum]EGC31852.1 hypothetical protein DICPUDRAFT_49939 [Dictyostelium purpureum]|eukprot:XP_003291622.1 hypothetical protein DICPUDRAFT_49939 [Dictyostelium purpureum]
MQNKTNDNNNNTLNNNGISFSSSDLETFAQLIKRSQQNPTPSEPKIKTTLTEEEILGEDNLNPNQILNKLDEYIIGQANAKKSVSSALRLRWRRKRVDPSIRADVSPKNILMIGPTGVGKTEIARRLAAIVNAPFIKVEATKYTEVGYHGPDVDTIIKDLIDVAISNIKSKIAESHKANIEADVEKEIITNILGPNGSNGSIEELTKLYRNKSIETIMVEIDVPNSFDKQHSSSIQLDDESPFIRLLVPGAASEKNSKKRKVTVSEARAILEKTYREKYTVSQDVTKLAIQSVEQNGIVFLDEIDKICTPRENYKNGGDASSDGVQRDLLPIIEGCNVSTKYGMVDTSKILFIASGAFHNSKPSDLISELQGRLPIRVELKPLEEEDFYRILTEPRNNQIKQQQALMKTENIDLQFTEEALREVAKITFESNAQIQNLGARRLHGIIERIIEDISFNCHLYKDQTVTIGVEDVRKKLSDLLLKTDLSKYII